MTDNELIALFMGFSFVQTEHDRFWNPPNLPKATTLKWCHHSIDLDHFRTSWDWLMPVVEKIASIHDANFRYDIDEILKGNFPDDDKYMSVIAIPLATEIKNAFIAVVEFIKWYNENNP